MNRRLSTALALTALVSATGVASASAANFAPGDLAVYRVGAGTAALTNAATATFVDEYTTAGALVQSFPAPVAVSGANQPLTASGTATSEGLLSRTGDGNYLTLTGYAAAPGLAGVAGTASTATARVIGRLAPSGAFDTSTALSDAFTANNIRSAYSPDGVTAYYAAGATEGVRAATPGATTSTLISDSFTNLRQLNAFGGQLYVSSGSGALRLGTVGTGTSTAAGQTITPFTFATAPNSPYAYALADLSSAVAGVDTLYLSDGGVVTKYSLVGATWRSNGTFTDSSGTTGLTLTSDPSGSTSIYTSSPTTIQAYTDTAGYNVAPSGGAAATTVATAATNTAFRGIALAPQGRAGVPATAAVWRGGSAKAARRGVLVSWKTGADPKNLGFEVLRVHKGSAKRVKLTKKLIAGSAATGSGMTHGSYSFRDLAGKSSDRYYIVSRSVSGKATIHGPLVVRAATRKAVR